MSLDKNKCSCWLLQIAKKICGFYRLSQAGDESKLKEELDKLPPPSNVHVSQQAQVSNGNQVTLVKRKICLILIRSCLNKYLYGE